MLQLPHFQQKQPCASSVLVLEPNWFQLGASLLFHRPRAKAGQRHDISIKRDHATVCLEVDLARVCETLA